MLNNILLIEKKLNEINKNLYIVGGFCREQALGNKNYDGDIDLATDATPEEIQSHFTVIGELGKKYGTCIINIKGENYEITTFRKDIGSVNHRKPAQVIFTQNLVEDSQRRDFTMNAIYFHPSSSCFIDPQNGIKDIENKILRFIGTPEERIQEDALRILRAVRFKNQYQLEFANQQYREILKENTSLLRKIPIERIKSELDKILLLQNNVQALEDLKTIGFLKIFLPELDILDQCSGNKRHKEGNVWIHTKMCLQEMNTIIQREKIKKLSTTLTLLWTILLHDIGKYPTYSLDELGEGHYYGHEEVGAKIFLENISKRFCFSKKMTKKITWIIAQHLRIFKIPDMKPLKARTLMMHEFFPYLILTGEADNNGRVPKNINRFLEITGLYKNFKIILKNKKFLTGEDIMKKYPELSGEEIGEKLTALNEQILIHDK